VAIIATTTQFATTIHFAALFSPIFDFMTVSCTRERNSYDINIMNVGRVLLFRFIGLRLWMLGRNPSPNADHRCELLILASSAR
jgi:hypothetical protein